MLLEPHLGVEYLLLDRLGRRPLHGKLGVFAAVVLALPGQSEIADFCLKFGFASEDRNT